ncbi:hypothetical protein PF005_g22301 [Phytophthora fragariae]|uniref:Uncharacterized protein n=1 Tax=Phytophthora fragariae TaxID=53985 RepID=A0A6A3E306_9STRA|nr:hypothetical protein PF003_g31568 [Phytophthora fragariae]KAE8926913.1 hypothetical protein PF009_g22909 [Phytophthora fragariae]KAE8985285.1 hypothetical protein PF011_g20451 [Phytophthora fragariae]KAE9084272.1 hypothetical protein PF010_g20900 [Phytophthora fragariae]KAE9085826.1 hypothetical protein PF007_g21002 [Phytophthora fragariae]
MAFAVFPVTKLDGAASVALKSFQHRSPSGVHFVSWSAPQVHADSSIFSLREDFVSCYIILARSAVSPPSWGSVGLKELVSLVRMSATRRLLVLNGLLGGSPTAERARAHSRSSPVS